MILRTLDTKRMTLIAATVPLIEADLQGRDQLAGAIKASIPENWPPDLYERQAMEFTLRQLQDEAEKSWSFWYLQTRLPREVEVIGICGFKGRPDDVGSVEIAYSVLSQFRNQGYASEAVFRLVLWAFSHQNVNQVTAETFPHLRQSIRVMEKNGFIFTGPGSEHGVVRYAVQRPDKN